MRPQCLKIKPPHIYWPPLATIGVALSFASYFGTRASYDNHVIIIALSIGTVVATIGLCCQSRLQVLACITASMFLVGFSRSATDSNPRVPTWATILEGDLVQLRCEITNDPHVVPRTKGEMAQFDHRPPATRFYANATPVANSAERPLQIAVRIDGICDLRKGDVIQCIGWLRESLRHQKKYALFVSSERVVQHIKRTSTDQHPSLRQSIRSRIMSGLEQEQKTLASALFFGVRDQGWDHVAHTFRLAGMSHILAISGLHVGLIILIVLRISTSIHSGKLFLFGTVLVVVSGLLFLIEPRPPVIRAVVMVAIISAGKCIGMRGNTAGLLGIAVIVLLAMRPAAAGTVGYQLSFIVVASLSLLLPAMKWRLIGPTDVHRSSRKQAQYWLASLWITGLCAWLVASPITAHVFGTMSPSGLVSSVPAIGMLVVALWVGVERLLIGWFSTTVDILAQHQLSFVLDIFSSMASFVGSLPMAHFHGIQLTWGWSTVLLSWVACWSIMMRRRVLLWCSAPLILFGLFSSHWHTSNNIVLTTIDVGHGTCHIIQAGASTIVVDGGSMHNLDVGTNTIVPALNALGVSSINTIIITHSDIDHCAGIPDVLRAFPVSKIIIAPQTRQHQTKPLSFVLDVATKNNIPIIDAATGWSESLGELTLSILSPRSDDVYRTSNGSSIVLLLEAHGRNIVLTGDIDGTTIGQLVGRLPKSIDLIELPHHGQWGRQVQSMINNHRPRFVIQSTNVARFAKDRWKFPEDCDRFVTAIDGTITTTIFTNGDITISGSNQPVSMNECLSSHY